MPTIKGVSLLMEMASWRRKPLRASGYRRVDGADCIRSAHQLRGGFLPRIRSQQRRMLPDELPEPYLCRMRVTASMPDQVEFHFRQ